MGQISDRLRPQPPRTAYAAQRLQRSLKRACCRLRGPLAPQWTDAWPQQCVLREFCWLVG